MSRALVEPKVETKLATECLDNARSSARERRECAQLYDRGQRQATPWALQTDNDAHQKTLISVS